MSAAPEPGAVFNPFLLFNGAWLPNGLLERTDLSPGAKLAYARLCQFAGEDGLVYPSIATLGKEIGIKERRARELVAELEEARLIERRPKPGKTNRFVFLWQQWIGAPRQDPAAPAGSRRPPRQDPAGEETQGRDSKKEAPPLRSPPRDGPLFGGSDQETEHACKRSNRGSRLASDWEPVDWDFAYGRDRGFHDAEITDHADNFKTHFTAGRGRNTTHLRWSGHGCSAFAVWLRKETPGQLGRGLSHARGNHAGGGRREVASVVEAVGKVIDRFSDPVAREPGDRRPA